MSLFTGPDADLPLLTQFVQLAVPKGENVNPEDLENSELEVWLLRREGHRHPEKPIVWVERANHAALFEENPDPGRAPRRPRRDYFPDGEPPIMLLEHRLQWQAQLRTLANLHDLACRIAAGVADRTGVPPSLLDQLNERLRDVRLLVGERMSYFFDNYSGVPERIEDARRIRRDRRDRPIPPDRLTLIVEDTAAAADREDPSGLGTRILLGLRDVLTTPNSMARCHECHSPFVVVRTNQQFCSRRCAARLGERRRRAQRKEREEGAGREVAALH